VGAFQESIFDGQWITLIGPSQKKTYIMVVMLPQIEVFSYQTSRMKRLLCNPSIYNTSSHFWAKDMRQIMMPLRNILGATFFESMFSPLLLLE
jgi:hypothetical protein